MHFASPCNSICLFVVTAIKERKRYFVGVSGDDKIVGFNVNVDSIKKDDKNYAVSLDLATKFPDLSASEGSYEKTMETSPGSWSNSDNMEVPEEASSDFFAALQMSYCGIVSEDFSYPARGVENRRTAVRASDLDKENKNNLNENNTKNGKVRKVSESKKRAFQPKPRPVMVKTSQYEIDKCIRMQEQMRVSYPVVSHDMKHSLRFWLATY